MIQFKSILILLHFILFTSVFCHRIEVKTKFLSDVLENENVPSSIVVKASCWTKRDMITFSKSISTTVEFFHGDVVKNQPLDDFTNKIWFFVDMQCEGSVEFITGTDPWFYGHPYRWIFYDITMKKSTALERLPFLTDSNVITAHFLEPNLFILQQFYKTHAKSMSVYYEDFGTWSQENGLVDERSTRILSRRRRDLKGRVVSVAMVLTNNDSINHLTDYRDRSIDSPSKASYLVCVNLIAAMNGTAKFNIEKTWGYEDPKTGEYNGMTGQVIRKEVDIGGTVLFIVPSRIPQMEFISKIVDTRFELVFRAPPLSYVSNIYYYPFVGLVWIASGILVLLGSIAIYYTYVLPQDRTRDDSRDAFSNVLLLAAGLIGQMGIHVNPRTLSGNISSFTALICLVFIVTSYTANIVALLQSTTKSISTLEDILNSEMEVGVQDTPYNRHYIPATTGDTQIKIYQTKIAPPGQEPNFFNLTYGIEKVRQGFFAFFVELGSGYDRIKKTYMENEKCGLIEMRFLHMSDPWFAIQKHSPLKEILKVNVFKIREHGLQSRETLKIYDSRPQCDSGGSTFGSVGLRECYAVLLIFFYGSLASFLVILCELIWRYKIICLKVVRKFKE